VLCARVDDVRVLCAVLCPLLAVSVSRSRALLSRACAGVVIGHELTHGFDDSGSQYDELGNLNSWWSPEVRARFEEKTRCLAEEYR
jgi:hypothetical protein